MCQSKASGGRRCAAHTVSDYAKSIVSKRATPESVTAKAEDVIVSPVGKTYYEDKGRELVTAGASNAEKANRNAAFLKAAKFHQTQLSAPAYVEGRPERDYMSESEKIEYDRCVDDSARKSWWDRKAQDEKEFMLNAAKEWRNDPSSYYDRLSMPNEHTSLASQKDLPAEYARIIATTTTNRTARSLAVKQYARKMEISVEEANAQLGEPAWVQEKREQDYHNENMREQERAMLSESKASESRNKAKKKSFMSWIRKYW